MTSERIDPRNHGRATPVILGGEPLGDLGNPRTDAHLLLAIALRGGKVADWLAQRGIDEATIRREFAALDLRFDGDD